MKFVVIAILVYFTMISVCVGQEDTYTWPQDRDLVNYSSNITISNYAFLYYQQVKGEGFHNFKQNVRSGDFFKRDNYLELDNFGHGSGSFDYESQHIVYNRARITNFLGDTESVSNFRILFNESADYVYGPTDFYFSKDFKSKPFNSKGKEGTCLKNFPQKADVDATGVSMDVLFDNSEVYSKDISADLHRRSHSWGLADVNQTSITYSNTSLGIEAAFTGNLHIGAFKFSGIPTDRLPGNDTTLGNLTRPRFNVTYLIDEDYSGTFSITKKMTDTYAKGTTKLEENFLPCCFEGWDTMPPIYQRKFGKDAKGIFDCRCHIGYAYGIDVALIPKEAQFHNT